MQCLATESRAPVDRDVLLPKLDLFRQILRFHFNGRCALNNMRALPLSPRHQYRPYAAFGRKIFFEPSDMRFLAREGDARPRIYAELDHLITVINQEIAEVRGSLALFPGAHRQIERDD